jgi:Lar family restriction alleviation protein
MTTPCPFCGSCDILFHSDNYKCGKDRVTFIFCGACGARGPVAEHDYSQDKIAAEHLWDTRVSDGFIPPKPWVAEYLRSRKEARKRP